MNAQIRHENKTTLVENTDSHTEHSRCERVHNFDYPIASLYIRFVFAFVKSTNIALISLFMIKYKNQCFQQLYKLFFPIKKLPETAIYTVKYFI